MGSLRVTMVKRLLKVVDNFLGCDGVDLILPAEVQNFFIGIEPFRILDLGKVVVVP